MADVYAAIASVDCLMAEILSYAAYAFSNKPLVQEIFETVQKKLKSFEVFMERLDLSSRVMLKNSFERVKGAADEFDEAIQTIGNQETKEAEAMSDEYFRAVEDFRQCSRSFIDTLEKCEDEYLQQHTHSSIHSKSKMIGLSDEYSKLKKQIIVEGWIDELVFSIVGMAGIGKTALANKLFQDLDILEWFDCCAWVTIGREYQLEEITQTILSQLGVDEHNMLTEDCLRECLEDKRCFIVLDDVWDMELVQNFLTTSSPNTISGSRVLVTTRIKHQYSFPYHLITMRLLNKHESWNLLSDKIFAQNSCPFEYEEAAKMIAEKCDGLPLTIVIVSDLLLKTPRSQWVNVATQKKHQLFIDAYDQVSKVLHPSYENLHDDLKLCFLYMAVFPQNYEIRKSKLFNLWIVEKIIEKRFFQTLEISCEKCLQTLALHNLVMVYQRSSTILNDLFERVKTCGLHSSWWHFCYKEARNNSFFYVLDSDTDASRELIKSQSRLTIHNNVLFGIKVVYKSIEENCGSTAHSLLCLGPYHQYPVSICYGLKLLKKLDAVNIRFYEFPLEVLELVKLRYLALTCNASLPSSISKLWKLQYLIVHRHLILKFGAPSYLPVEIWDLKRLKYLHVTGSDLPDVGDTFLSNLLTLSDVSFNSCTDGVVRRIPNLTKLGIRIDLMPDAVEPLCCFDHVSHLSQLQSLKYDIVNPTCNFEVVVPRVQLSIFPLTLKKLCLSGLGYPWNEMSMISSLPNLEVLKLRNNAFQGPLWKVAKDDFPKLCFLQMEDIDLEILDAKDSFKCIKKLSIKDCYKLRKLRFIIKDEIVSNFEVVDCNPRIQRDIQKRVIKTSEMPRQFLVHFSWNSTSEAP